MYREFFIYRGKAVTVILRTDKDNLRYSEILDDLDRLISWLRDCRDQYPKTAPQILIDESNACSSEE